MLQPGDRIEILPEPASSERVSEGLSPDFKIILEDNDLIVVDKPPGLVVHPAAGCRSVTLMEALVQTRPQMVGCRGRESMGNSSSPGQGHLRGDGCGQNGCGSCFFIGSI